MPFSVVFSHSHVCSPPPPPNTQCSMGNLNNVGILYDVYEKRRLFHCLHLIL